MKQLIFILLAAILIAACTNVQQPQTTPTGTDGNQPPSAPEKQTPQPKPETVKPQTCEQKAMTVIPKALTLTLAYSKNPNVSIWDLRPNSTWLDGTPIDMKGKIGFQKGSAEGEDPNLWYTVNTQNEKLFGIGGLKYQKKLTGAETGTNFFIIKPTLKTEYIRQPEPYDPYVVNFEIVNYGFVNCSWSG